jgi:hypothetical protein
MLGSYVSFLVILGLSALLGQAVFAACGRRSWSPLAPAVGLAALAAIAWGTVRLPGEGGAALVAIGIAAGASAIYVRGPLDDLPRALALALPVGIAALLLSSLPFLVEGRFGILGTGLNPDMSQHLFAADRLADGEGGRLLSDGYPLGPHSIVVAISELGPSPVHAFDGLTLSIAVAACLAPLALLERLSAARRTAAALLVGLPYMVASYLIQGAFKETIEALFVLGFAIGLHELARGELIRDPASRTLRAVPLAVIAVGAVYSYSFPGLIWLGGGTAAWVLIELGLAAWRGPRGSAASLLRAAAPAGGAALGLFAIAVAPETGRLIDFASFETFDPSGPGLGNLFNRISPLEALGIWPSGDFRLDPGDGAAPAVAYYLGGALALAALAYGLAWWLRRGERAVPAVLAAAAGLVLYALVAGTPYQEAKSIVLASPLAMLISARALVSGEPLALPGGRLARLGAWALGPAFLAAAAACTLIALVNGPVGPATYSPALTELRPALDSGSTLMLAPEELLADEHGRDYLVWELRGGRVCVEVAAPMSGAPPNGIAHVITQGSGATAPFAGLRLERRSGPYVLWARNPAPRGEGPCPLISPGGRANPAGDQFGSSGQFWAYRDPNRPLGEPRARLGPRIAWIAGWPRSR